MRRNLIIYRRISEVLSPQRPPAPPTEYLQVNIGGYDPYNLLSVNSHTKLEGYVGCIRGLKIGNNVTELIKPLNNTTNNTGKSARISERVFNFPLVPLYKYENWSSIEIKYTIYDSALILFQWKINSGYSNLEVA